MADTLGKNGWITYFLTVFSPGLDGLDFLSPIGAILNAKVQAPCLPCHQNYHHIPDSSLPIFDLDVVFSPRISLRQFAAEPAGSYGNFANPTLATKTTLSGLQTVALTVTEICARLSRHLSRGLPDLTSLLNNP